MQTLQENLREINYHQSLETSVDDSTTYIDGESESNEVNETFPASPHKIGEDMNAGEYVLYADSEISYFQVSNDSSGSLESISANGDFKTNTIVSVTKLDTSSQGMFKVGIHLEPEELSGCYIME